MKIKLDYYDNTFRIIGRTFNDEGTVSLMSDFISEQEKTLWMMRSWLNE